MSHPFLLTSCLLMVAACDQSRVAEPFEARARLDLTRAVFLNQSISVVFSEAVDPLTVGRETIRVVDAEGHAVPGQQPDLHAEKVVTISFRAPLTATLGDGSLAPDRNYRLEVIGYPELHSVRARSGRVLSRSLFASFHTVGRNGRADYARPLLPQEIGGTFTLVRRPELLGTTGILRLSFTRSPDPVTVQPAAFRVHRLQDGGVVPVEIVSATSTSGRDGPFGATVELKILGGDQGGLWVTLVDGDAGLLDYGGQALVGERLFHVAMQAESSRVVAKVVASDQPTLHPVRLDQIGFEVRDRVRLAPAARLAGGSGRMGFVRVDAAVPVTVGGDALELSGLEIPAGSRLTLGGQDAPVLIRVSGSVRIAGELVLATPRNAVAEPDTGAIVREEHLAGLAGCVIVASGDIEVSGRITHVQERQPMGPSLALVAGRRLVLTGRTPPGMIYACEGQIVGHAQAASPRGLYMPRGWGGSAPCEAASFTDWMRIPEWATGELVTQLVDVEGPIEVLVQTAPAHPLDPERPDPQPEVWSQPRPAAEPLVGAAGRFVRFMLRCPVAPAPASLSSVGGILLLKR